MKNPLITLALLALSFCMINRVSAKERSFQLHNSFKISIATDTASDDNPRHTVSTDNNQTSNTATVSAQLISFKSAVRNQSAEIIWATKKELNIAYFELERSCDGLNFTRFAKIPSLGSEISINNYRGIDDLSANASFYRLKLIDNMGKVFYSKTVSVESSERL